MAIWVWASAAVAFLNVTMTLALLSIYLKSYLSIRSTFTLGLVLFASLFAITNIAIIGLWLFIFTTPLLSAVAEQGFAYMFVVNTFVALAIVNLLRVTWK